MAKSKRDKSKRPKSKRDKSKRDKSKRPKSKRPTIKLQQKKKITKKYRHTMKKERKGSLRKVMPTGLYPAFDKYWESQPLQPSEELRYTDYFSRNELMKFNKQIEKETSSSKKKDILNEMKNLAIKKGYIHTKECKKYPPELMDVFKEKYTGISLVNFCNNNWYRVYTRDKPFRTNGYLVTNVFTNGPIVIENWESAPLSKKLFQPMGIIGSPNEPYKKRMHDLSLSSTKYLVDNKIVKKSVESMIVKSKGNNILGSNGKRDIDYSITSKLRKNMGGGSKDKVSSVSKSKITTPKVRYNPGIDIDPIPLPTPILDEYGCYNFLDNKLFSDVDGVYVSVGIIPNSEDIINNFMNKRRRDEDGILSISTYLEGDDGTVIWENTDKEILEQFNIYSLEDSKKCQSTAYILSVIEISDKKIISETNILVKSGVLYYYSSNYGRGTGRQKKTRNLSDTSRDGGNCCPFFYDECKTSLLTKEVIMSDRITRSR